MDVILKTDRYFMCNYFRSVAKITIGDDSDPHGLANLIAVSNTRRQA